MTIRQIVILSVAFAILLLLPFWGAEPLEWGQLFTESVSRRILFELRIPRLFFVVLIGGTLSVLGGTYQVLFKNPLAEPYILGVSSAVVLGVVLAQSFLGLAPHSPGAVVAGGLGAFLSTFLLMMLGLSSTGKQVERIILFGMGLNFVLSSLLFLVLSYFNQQVGAGTLRWLFGHIPWLSFAEAIMISLLCAPLLIALFVRGRHLDALSLGDGVARTLGFSPIRSRNWFLGTSSLLLAILVAYTGSIGFVGLVIPHLVRLIFQPSSSRHLFLLSFPLGALFLGVADSLSRTLLPPFEFPIGILTTLTGGPLFLYLLWVRTRR